MKDLFNMEDDDTIKFTFDKPDFDVEFPSIENCVGFENAELIRMLKTVYDWSRLCEILGDNTYLSYARVESYEKHNTDLRILKDYIRTKFGNEKYREMFRYNGKDDNYAKYIGMDKQKSYGKCGQDEFYKYVKKSLKLENVDANDNEGDYIKSEIEKKTFLPKQITSANGVIPYQVHLTELNTILNNAKMNFPFLSDVSDGMTVAEKIESLMTFRIPYYVGPLNTQSKFSWVVRREGFRKTCVTPWNFEKVIDKDKSEDEFILRMTNKCTYIKGEDVIPAGSLLYSEFAFLNELNNLRINGVRNDEARCIIYEYAKENKKISVASCLKLLKNRGIIEKTAKVQDVFSGIDGDFKQSLASYYNIKQIIGDKVDSDSEMCEEIILWSTLVSDKKRLENRIKQKYGGKLNDNEIKSLKNLSFSKWGRFSKVLLTEIKSDMLINESGEHMSIIEAMREIGENFMELLSNRYDFKKKIDERNNIGNDENVVSYKTVSDLYCTPSVKRSIWRTIELVREIKKICGKAPKKVFVETIREIKDNGKKGKRTVSRKQQILDLFNNIKDEERDWKNEIERQPDSMFDSVKAVLYYRQKGKCMYTGKEIRMDELFNKKIIDKEHIYPKSKIKDDSLDNLVLVYRTENAKKSDNYPIDQSIRDKMKPFWQMLRNQGFISDEKLYRLTRSTPLTQAEKNDFVARQLVSTSQSTKLVCELLKKLLPETKVVYAKAANANEFKAQNDLIKIRDLNDLHHAKDAYINIVVGNVFDTEFSRVFGDGKISFAGDYNFDNLFKSDIQGAWRVRDMDRILSIAKKYTCKVVRMTTSGSGGLFDINPVSGKGINDGVLLPLKENKPISNTKKYGGYNKAKTAYFMLVRSKGKDGMVLLTLEAYPLYLELKYQGSKEEKERFCREEKGLVDPEIVLYYIKIHTLIFVDGSYANINGKSNNYILISNANELYLKEEYQKILKEICKYIELKKKSKGAAKCQESITSYKNLLLYDELTEKLSSKMYNGLSIQGQSAVLRSKRDVFALLSVEEQCTVIFEVIKLMQCNSVAADLSLIGKGAHVGINTMNKVVKSNDLKFIFQSPTGYYRKVIDIKEFL